MSRTGGVYTSNSKHETDIYLNKRNANEILKYLLPHYHHIKFPTILDACSNTGVLGFELLEDLFDNEASLYCYDAKYHGDINKWECKYKYDIIVSNPPWVPVTLAKSIYEKLLSLLSENGVLVFLINNTFVYQGIDRARELKFHKYYFLPRYTFASAGKPLLDCGIMIYHNNNKIPDEAGKLKPFIDITKIKTTK